MDKDPTTENAGRSTADNVERQRPNDVEWQGLSSLPSTADDKDRSPIDGAFGAAVRDEVNTGVDHGRHEPSGRRSPKHSLGKEDDVDAMVDPSTREGDSSPKQPELERQERAGAFQPEPGAYRIRDGANPRRATSFVSYVSHRGRPASRSAPQSSADEAAVMVEARLVAEEEKRETDEPPEPRNASLLVEATPVHPARRTRQIVLSIASLAIVAAVVGLAVGLTRDNSTSPAIPDTPTSIDSPGSDQSSSPTALRSSGPSFSPTTVPSSRPTSVPSNLPTTFPSTAPSTSLTSLVLSTLPLQTAVSLHDPTSPQAKAFEWLRGHYTNLDVNPQIDGQEVWLARVRQRFALATLYYATGGETSWNGTDRWLDVNAHECTWFGCCCGASCTVADGALSSVKLEGSGLAGKLPLEIGLLTSLEQLNLGDNALTGSTPTEIGDLSSLSSLYLFGNRLSSTIPTELGLLNHMTDLQMSRNGLTGSIPSQLGQLSELSCLALWQNQLNFTIPSQLGQLTSMTYLTIGFNKLSGPIPTQLAKLSALSTLYIPNCRLSSTIPTQLGDLSVLSDLTLADNLLTGPIPTHVGKLTALVSLWLDHNRLTSVLPTQLGMLSNLLPSYPIRLGFNNLSGSVPSGLCQVRNANRLDIVVDCDEVACACNCSCAELATDDYYYR